MADFRQLENQAENQVKGQVGVVTARVFARAKNDFYPTPAWCTRALLDEEPFAGASWEPAAGDGAIVDVFKAAGLPVIGTDLVDRGRADIAPGVDFLLPFSAPLAAFDAPNIVTNPPFDLAVAFVDRALQLASRKVAMLLRWNWVASQGLRTDKPCPRVNLLRRADRVLVLGRVNFLPPGGVDLGHGPKHDFCWVIWNKTTPPRPGDDRDGPAITWVDRGRYLSAPAGEVV